MHQERGFTWAYFKKIERHGHYCVVFLDLERSNGRKNLLVPFSTVTEVTSDVYEQEAMLTHLSCNDGIARYGPILAGMLKGKCRL